MSNVKENFLRYVQIETTSSETSGTCPSTPNQWVLAKMLVDELHAMGIDNARVDDHCYVYATIPAKGNHPAKVGLISHMDTSDGVKARRTPSSSNTTTAAPSRSKTAWSSTASRS